MKYTELDLRKAYQLGYDRALALEGYPIEDTLTEDEYIDSLKLSVVEEDKISFTYSFLRRKMDWEDFCKLTGTSEWYKSEGGEIKDTDIFYVTESKAKQFNLI